MYLCWELTSPHPDSQPWQDNGPQHRLPLTPKPDSDDNHWKHLYSLSHKKRHRLDGEAMAAGDLRASSPRAKIPSLLKHLLPCGFADFMWELWQRPDWIGTDFNFILCRVAKQMRPHVGNTRFLLFLLINSSSSYQSQLRHHSSVVSSLPKWEINSPSSVKTSLAVIILYLLVSM